MQFHTNSYTSWTILSDTNWVKIASNTFLSRYLNLFQVGEFFGIETQSAAKKKKRKGGRWAQSNVNKLPRQKNSKPVEWIREEIFILSVIFLMFFQLVIGFKMAKSDFGNANLSNSYRFYLFNTFPRTDRSLDWNFWDLNLCI